MAGAYDRALPNTNNLKKKGWEEVNNFLLWRFKGELLNVRTICVMDCIDTWWHDIGIISYNLY